MNRRSLISMIRGPGTYWVAYRKRGNNVVYFDSFGDLQPPVELLNYLGVCTVAT